MTETSDLTTLYPRALNTLPECDDLDSLLSSDTDAICRLDLCSQNRQVGWLDDEGGPHVIMLHNAVFYPYHALSNRQQFEPNGLPKGLSLGNLGLVTTQEGDIFPDSLGKSHQVPKCVCPTADDSPWSADLPPVTEEIAGTHLFAELFFGHFGHAIVDNPSRLWPIGMGLLDADRVDGVIGTGHMGGGYNLDTMPGYVAKIIESLGIPLWKLLFQRDVLRIERLLLPRRMAPYLSLWDRSIALMMGGVGDNILLNEPSLFNQPRKIWLSRSNFAEDARGNDGALELDALFEEQGFTVIHPQELPFEQQVALAQGATHMAGLIGSQLHLCAFGNKPGQKLFEIGPRYLVNPINRKFQMARGGTVDEFLLDIPRPAGLRHQAPWSFPTDRLPELRDAVIAWSQND